MKEITPKPMRCICSCPSLHEVESAEGETLVAVIGTIPSAELIERLAHKLAPDEQLVMVPKGLLVDIEWTKE